MKGTDYFKDGSSEHDDYINERMGELKRILLKLLENLNKWGQSILVTNISDICVLSLINIYKNLYKEIHYGCQMR